MSEVRFPRFKIKYVKPNFELIVNYQIKRSLLSSIHHLLKKIDKKREDSYVLPPGNYNNILRQSTKLLDSIEKEIQKKYPFFSFLKTDLHDLRLQFIDREWIGVNIVYGGWINA